MIDKPDCRDALALALDRGIWEPGDQGVQFCNASVLPALAEEWKRALRCDQGFRPEFLKLERAGYTLSEQDSAGAGAIILLTRSRRLNEHIIGEQWNRLGAGKPIIIAGNKKDGIGAIRKWFAQHAEVKDSFSKYHAVVFWGETTGKPDFPDIDITRQADGYCIEEGVFSSDGPDAGSKLLVEHFDTRIRGKVADLGAGWGYLSGELLNKSDRVTEIHLFEADRRSLTLAKQNIERHLHCDARFHWIDVTTEFPKKPYDWVIMNPPFHSGRAAEPGLGQRFIEVAASTLPRGGRLLMVANKNLPYEKVLEAKFRNFEKLSERDGFKVFEAVK